MSSKYDLDEIAQEKANVRLIKNENDVQLYSNQIAILSSFREIIDYHFPVLKNIEIANDFFDKSLLYFVSNNTPFIFSELNRVFCNCVESFYMFDQLCQKRLKWPKELISKYYDRYFEFRFISEIRNYSIHHHLPLTQYETIFREGGITQTFNIDVSIIIKDEKIEKKLKSDLDRYLLTSKNIDVKQLFKDYYDIFNNLLCDILLLKKDEVLTAFKTLRDIMDNKHGNIYKITCLNRPDGSKADVGKVVNDFLLELSGFVDRIGIENIKSKEFVAFYLQLTRIYLKRDNAIIKINRLF